MTNPIIPTKEAEVEAKLERDLTKVSAGLTGATAIGVGVAVGVKSDKLDVQGYFSHLLIKDKPINEIPIVIAHNANTYMGSGTVDFRIVVGVP